MRLHGYFRSAASWRVRIALNLKGVEVTHVPHHLRRGAQRAPEYLALNPQGLVPALELNDGGVLTQSLAIIEWLEEAYPEPKLLPSDMIERAHVRAFALVLAADTHPLQNLCVLGRLREMGRPEHDVRAWAAKVNEAGLKSCEALISGGAGPFCFWWSTDYRRYLPCTATWQCSAFWSRRFPISTPAAKRGRMLGNVSFRRCYP